MSGTFASDKHEINVQLLDDARMREMVMKSRCQGWMQYSCGKVSDARETESDIAVLLHSCSKLFRERPVSVNTPAKSGESQSNKCGVWMVELIIRRAQTLPRIRQIDVHTDGRSLNLLLLGHLGKKSLNSFTAARPS